MGSPQTMCSGYVAGDPTPHWVLEVAWAALARATDATTVTYAQVRTEAVWLMLTDLNLRAVTGSLGAALPGVPVWPGRS